MPWRRWTTDRTTLFTFAEGATGAQPGSFSVGKLVIAVTPENADPPRLGLFKFVNKVLNRCLAVSRPMPLERTSGRRGEHGTAQYWWAG